MFIAMPFTEFFEKHVHTLCIHMRQDERNRYSILGTCCRIGVRIFANNLTGNDRSLASFGPTGKRFTDSPETGFILKEELKRLCDGTNNLGECFREFF